MLAALQIVASLQPTRRIARVIHLHCLAGHRQRPQRFRAAAVERVRPEPGDRGRISSDDGDDREGADADGPVVEDSPQRIVLKMQGGKLETVPREHLARRLAAVLSSPAPSPFRKAA